MKPLRWGILGCGDIAEKTFAPCLVHSPLCELVAVSRRNGELARTFAEQFTVPAWYDNDADLLARPDIDAVVIATPPHVHCAQTEAAAARASTYWWRSRWRSLRKNAAA